MKTHVVETADLAPLMGRASNEVIELCRTRARNLIERLCQERGWTLLRAVSEEIREAPDYATTRGVPLLVTIQWELVA